MSNWESTVSETDTPGWTCPENLKILTKIDDKYGVRNEQIMMRRGNLWYVNVGDPGEMYVYYVPTHWKPIQ